MIHHEYMDGLILEFLMEFLWNSWRDSLRHATCDMRLLLNCEITWVNATCDMWHATCDMWHATCEFLSQKNSAHCIFSPYKFGPYVKTFTGELSLLVTFELDFVTFHLSSSSCGFYEFCVLPLEDWWSEILPNLWRRDWNLPHKKLRVEISTSLGDFEQLVHFQDNF